MTSHDFEQFYESCFDNSFGFVRDGVNEKAILNLQGDEKIEAERLLLENLGANNDSRLVVALGLLCSKEAAEPLKKRLEVVTGIDRIQTALALFRIEKYPEAEKIIIDCLKITNGNKPDEMTRWLAAGILPRLGKTSQVVQALLEAMVEDNEVGHSATSSLRTLFIDDEPVRNFLGQISLVLHDVHNPDFIGRPKLVKQAVELINARLTR
jgi:HEAT repeat protein